MQRLTERTDSSDNAQRLPVTSCFHILGHLKHLPGDLGGNAAGGLRHLETTEDISLGIRERLTLLESNRRCKTIPVGTDEARELEKDLLSVHDAGSAPCGESFLGRTHGRLELLIRALGNASDEIVCSRIVQINPCCRLGWNELVVNEVGRVDWVGNRFVSGRVLCCRSGSGGRCSDQLACRGMQPPGRDHRERNLLRN